MRRATCLQKTKNETPIGMTSLACSCRQVFFVAVGGLSSLWTEIEEASFLWTEIEEASFLWTETKGRCQLWTE